MKKAATKLITSAGLMLMIGNSLLAQEWRGIRPLQSTRDDIRRLLGASPDANDLRSKYRLDKEEVYVVFSTKGFCDADTEKVPPGTVLLIQVTPKRDLRLADLQIDEKKFRRFDPSTPPGIGYEGYINADDGIIFRTHMGRVDEVVYIAAAKDVHLCPDYYENPEKFIRVLVDPPVKFDE